MLVAYRLAGSMRDGLARQARRCGKAVNFPGFRALGPSLPADLRASLSF